MASASDPSNWVAGTYASSKRGGFEWLGLARGVTVLALQRLLKGTGLEDAMSRTLGAMKRSYPMHANRAKP